MAPQDLYGLPGAGAAGAIVTLKKGSGAGDYTTTSTTYVDVDATNLVYTVVVPIGQKLFVVVALSGRSGGNATNNIALTDSTTVLIEATRVNGSTTDIVPSSLAYVFVGDGASHTFKLRWSTSTGSVSIYNSSPTLTPTMAFWLGVAN